MWYFFLSCGVQQGTQKCDCSSFIHILAYRFNPIRSELETVLDF